MPIDKAYRGDQLVGTYDARHFGGPGGRFVYEKDLRILERLLGQPQELLLDIPCGTGIYSASLQEQRHTVIGSDASQDMLVLAAARHVGIPLFQADINHIPFASDSLSAVMIIRLFQHLTRHQFQHVLHEAKRVIRPEGCILFDTLRWSPRRVGAEDEHGMHVYSLPACRDIIKGEGLKVRSSVSAYLFSAIRYRRLPLSVLHSLEAIEAVLPPQLKLRTFWCCGK